MFVRFLACALIGWAMVEVALYVAICHHKQLPVQILSCVVKSIPLVLGLSIGLLRPLKGLMIAQQYRHRAAEGRIEGQ